MPDRIAQVVRQRPNRKRILVDRLRIAKQPGNEISRANVVREIAEKLFAERVVPHVLDRRPAVRVGMGYAQLLFSRSGESLQQKRPDGIIPRQVNQLFVGQDGVRRGVARTQQEDQQNSHSANRSPQSDSSGMPISAGPTLAFPTCDRCNRKV